jgi:hypothetical protein
MNCRFGWTAGQHQCCSLLGAERTSIDFGVRCNMLRLTHHVSLPLHREDFEAEIFNLTPARESVRVAKFLGSVQILSHI